MTPVTDQSPEPDHKAAQNVDQFSGFADVYDRYRPAVPSVIVDILTRLAHVSRPALVIDLGCGTGLSTRVWAGRAESVIGIEPNADMRTEAECRSVDLTGIRYQYGVSTTTGLPDGCADIVTVSQALHWMEPTGTFAEIARLLRPGGVFAAIDNDSPPLVDWEVERIEQAFMAHCRRISEQHGIDYPGQLLRWQKHEHLERMTASGHFCYTREIAAHNIETGDADRLVGLALSQSSIQELFKHGLNESDIGLPTFRSEASRILGDGPHPFYFTYRIRIGVK
jgi:SAM-dependent methyltransferase